MVENLTIEGPLDNPFSLRPLHDKLRIGNEGRDSVVSIVTQY
jgi:hypothetical protein